MEMRGAMDRMMDGCINLDDVIIMNSTLNIARPRMTICEVGYSFIRNNLWASL
tara:strand:- start:450 stop:608 length:159 start_codon:yes stop_codon:yes gene_type:complete